MDLVNQWKTDYSKDEKKVIAQKAFTRFDTLTFLAKKDYNISHFFNTKVFDGCVSDCWGRLVFSTRCFKTKRHLLLNKLHLNP